MFRELAEELKKPNVVVVDTLPKARLMNKLLLAKIVILTLFIEGLLWLGNNPAWVLILVPIAIAAFTLRGLRRDLRNQRDRFGSNQ
ncbi:MAG TPA: hypothetical protein V6C81_26805 [Planktothrix sp.]|jgi:hypothetical protein